MSVVLGVIKKLLLLLGGKKLGKLFYKLVVRPELIALSLKVDPDEASQIDDNLIKLIDEVVEGL